MTVYLGRLRMDCYHTLLRPCDKITKALRPFCCYKYRTGFNHANLHIVIFLCLVFYVVYLRRPRTGTTRENRNPANGGCQEARPIDEIEATSLFINLSSVHQKDSASSNIMSSSCPTRRRTRISKPKRARSKRYASNHDIASKIKSINRCPLFLETSHRILKEKRRTRKVEIRRKRRTSTASRTRSAPKRQKGCKSQSEQKHEDGYSEEREIVQMTKMEMKRQ
jgi:hypothetical protein